MERPVPGHWLSQLCSQLESCRTIDDIQYLLDGLDTTLLFQSQVESVLKQLQEATQYRQLLELMLSCGSWCETLSAWLLTSFPSAEEFCASIHCVVLERLSLFILFLQFPFDRATELSLSNARIRVELTPPVLKAIISLSFERTDEDRGMDEASLDGFVIGKKRTQSRYKKCRQTKKQSRGLNSRDLEKLGISEPLSQTDAQETAQLLVVALKSDLKDYLHILRNEEVASMLQKMIVEQGLPKPSGSPHTETRRSTVNTSLEAPSPKLPSAYPLVQPMKAALYFESASGFGEWRILVSTRADRDLREARRSDANFFKIIVKKVIELSNGHFSGDNQKRLNKADVDFPLFEAKMTRDSRLVYQIDCIPEYDNNFERQVIKIFGIYTHAQINKRFWDSMGHQLAGKGKKYLDRCKFRNRPYHTGDNVILPATFPQQEKETSPVSVIPELPKEDLEEIHSLLVLGKFVTLSKELLNSIVADLDVAHVFNVTPQEKEIIEHQYSCYVLGRSGTGKTTTMLFKMLGIERAHTQMLEISLPDKPRQMFVTQSRVLATCVEEYFAKLKESLSVGKKSKTELKQIAHKKKLQREEGNVLFDAEDDVTWKAGLPQKFSLLQDEHFPLFVTFDKLSQLLEGDIEHTDLRKTAGPDSNRKFLTCDVFSRTYWPHFPQDLTKNLDPSLVFNEILGVIEGSEESLSHEARYLDPASYENLSQRAQYVFARQRDRVYSLFMAYLKQKQHCGDLDSADRTHRILKAFENSGIPGTKIDYLYVDEAQDNLLIDAMLLRALCRNPNGLFWAGDSAQTIAMGSAFRFNDLKAFLYRLERRREQKLIHSCDISQSELRTFQLAVNYRSHGGIVRCATAVIELITHFWPYAIDALAPEQGIVDGAKPVFFNGWDTSTVRYEKFLLGDSGERIEFGASQCILVRDETARTELRKKFGKIGVILTLYESKGLEFDDVLLYKFFEDSTVDLNRWRVVLNLVQKGNSDPAPQFDEDRHARVCSELKFLYVAITRSRKNLWIVDCSDKAEPMRMLWNSKGFIQDCKPGRDVLRLAVRSTPKEWGNTGRTLFANRRYLEAMHAFDRAGLSREAQITHTHHLREEARLLQPKHKEKGTSKREAFRVAAHSFLECARGAKGKEQRVYFHNAGDCFEAAASCGENTKDYGNAARAYSAAKEYNTAVRLYRKIDMFDEALEIVQNHRQELDPALAKNVLEIARLFYFRKKEFSKARTLFDSVEEQLEYLEDSILLDECHATVLVDLGRYKEAADIHISEGRMMEAIKVLLEDKESLESIQRANECIIQGLWQNTSFSQKIKDSDTVALDFLQVASNVDQSLFSLSQRDEIMMFENLHNSVDSSVFRQLAYRFLERDEIHQALLCFDHYFVTFPEMGNINNANLAAILKHFWVYCRLFRDIIVTLDLADEATQKLFSFQPASIEHGYRLRNDSWLSQKIAGPGAGPSVQILDSDEESVVVPGPDLHYSLKNHLWQRLEYRLLDENALCHLSNVFTPCLHYAMNRFCRRIECPQIHIQSQDLTQAWFNTQLRIHLLQILIYQVYHSIPPRKNTIPERRFWTHRLYETLRPTTHYLGSHASVRLASIPEAQHAIKVVKHWLRDILSTRHQSTDRLFASFLYEAAALYLLFDSEGARQYLPRSPLLGVFSSNPLYYRKAGDTKEYIIRELYQCLQAADKGFISAGILFVKQVVDQKVPIDVNVLCNLVEFLAGSFILARRQFNPHQVTLPRSWFLALPDQILMREPDTFLIKFLLSSMGILLKALVNGGDAATFLLFEHRDLSNLPTIRELFIPTICRALGLVGYNFDYSDLRAEILRIMEVLHPVVKPHRLYRRFYNARFWGRVRVAVETSCADSHLDEMVQLWSTDKGDDQARPAPEGVRRVYFDTLEDIPLALSAVPVKANPQREFDPLLPKVDNSAVAEDEEAIDQPVDQSYEAISTDLVDPQALGDSFSSTAAPLVIENITDEQKAVAARFAEAYRRLIRSKKLGKSKSSAEKTCDSFFVTCLTLSKDMEWPQGFYYRKLYLGLVPHLLACVNAVESYAHSAKGKAKKLLLDEKQDLDGLNKKMTELSTIFKSSKTLFRRLEPASELHKQRDIDQLKCLVGKVADLVNSVPPEAGVDVQFHLKLAVKGIVLEEKKPKPEPKPELNTAEDDLYETEDGEYY